MTTLYLYSPDEATPFFMTTPLQLRHKLSEQLNQCSYDHLRSVGAFLQVGLQGAARNRKRNWADAIAAYLANPTMLHALWDRFSPDAQHAAQRLARVRSLPSQPVLKEYGGIHGTGKPDRPLSPLAELYRAGLLLGVEHWDPQQALRLYVPHELMGFIIDPLPEEDAAQFETVRQTLPPLLHDLTQLLLLLCRYPPIQLLHGRWLPRTALGQLAERLITPVEITGRTTHKQAPYLRNLMFWAAACDLIDNGRLTPTAWRWMAQEPTACLRDLWSAWQTTAADVRFVFLQPDAFWSDALRKVFCRKLEANKGVISAARLADQLLENEQISPADFAANFETISDFDASVSTCLSGVMVDLGIMQPAADADGFRLTSLGDRVLNKAQNPLSDWAWKSESTLRQDADTAIVIRAEQYAPPFSQAVLTLFAEAEAGMQPLTFRLTARSISRAASLGHGLALLLEALGELYPDLNRDQIAMLWKWWKSGRSVKLQYLPIIQTEQKDQLAAIISNPATGRLVDQVLGPRAATWSGDLTDAVNALNHAGVFPVVRQQDNVGETDQNREALWLAGQVYQLLGEYMPLPYPLSTIALTDETVGMTPARQAVLGEHLAQIRERLQSLLDGFPYLPPPTPTDPEQWTEQISAAIDDQSSLIIRYHSAGRNVETSRRIRPYWEETHRGVRYLRAECIDSGAILVFRLDRIIDLQQSGN